jgi:hypothetical protein
MSIESDAKLLDRTPVHDPDGIVGRPQPLRGEAAMFFTVALLTPPTGTPMSTLTPETLMRDTRPMATRFRIPMTHRGSVAVADGST